MKEKIANVSWWWGFILIGGCFISSNVSITTNHGIRDLPYIQFDYTIYLLAVLIFVFLATILKIAVTKQPIKVDKILWLLVFRIVLAVIPSLYMTEHYYWGNIISYAIAPIVYFIMLNRDIYIENILPFAKIFALVTVIQCLILFANSPVQYTDTLYKYYFVSPVGASNYLGCIMLILFAVVFYSNKEKKKKWIWFSIGLIAIFLTKSRTSLFTYILIPCMDALVTAIKRKTISAKVLRRAIFILLFCTIFASSEIGATLKELIDSFIGGFTSSGSDITSGRMEQFINQFSIAAKHPLFGVGFTFGDSNGSMHNFILESFYVSGLVGLLVQFFLLKYIYKYIKDQNKKMGWILIAIFMVALFEKILFTTVGEFILWSVVGVIYNEKDVNQSTILIS